MKKTKKTVVICGYGGSFLQAAKIIESIKKQSIKDIVIFSHSLGSAASYMEININKKPKK